MLCLLLISVPQLLWHVSILHTVKILVTNFLFTKENALYCFVRNSIKSEWNILCYLVPYRVTGGIITSVQSHLNVMNLIMTLHSILRWPQFCTVWCKINAEKKHLSLFTVHAFHIHSQVSPPVNSINCCLFRYFNRLQFIQSYIYTVPTS